MGSCNSTIPALALATLRDLTARFKTQSSQRGGRNPDEIKRCLNLLLRCGPDADPLYTELYDRAVKENTNASSGGSRDLYFAYGLEKSIRTGDNPNYQAMGWLLGDEVGADPANPNATLVYELRIQHPYDKGGQGIYPTSRGRSFPGSEGERTLTFSYGPDPAYTKPIGQLKTTKTFGTWTGPIPPGSGVLKVTVDVPRAKDAAALAELAAAASKEPDAKPTPPTSEDANGENGRRGRLSSSDEAQRGDYWLRIVRAPNLWVNPGFDGLANRSDGATFSLDGWKDLPAGFWRLGHGDNPFPGKPYVQADVYPREQKTIYGAHIPVEAGHSYFQSAWVRDGGEGSSIRLGRRYLDADGNVIKTSDCPDFSTITWRWHTQRLLPGRANGKDSDAIPSRAAFIEPFIPLPGRGGLDRAVRGEDGLKRLSAA